MNNISAVVFDLDGTLYRGDSAVEGAVDAVNALVRLNYRIFYFTNNSAKGREKIVGKLNRLGFQAKLQNVYCASHAIATYLSEENLKTVYLIGSGGLKNELTACNIKIMNSPQVSAVVVGLDQSFDYDKITMALEAVNNGAKLIAANSDPSYPIEGNRRLPGCGAMVGAIIGATSRSPDFTAGKPNTYMLKMLCRDHALSPAEICVVGDSAEIDIRMAVNFKCQGILFDPMDIFPAFWGDRIRRHPEIILLISKEGRANE